MKNLEKITVLVVEDDDLSRQVLEDYLVENLNFNVISASDGLMGFTKLKTDKADLILLDIMMPRMDGFSFLQKMRDEKLKIPTIMITALGDASKVKKALGLGAVDFIVKPYDLSDIKQKIARALNIDETDIGKKDSSLSFDIRNSGNIFVVHIEGALNPDDLMTMSKNLVDEAMDIFSGKIKVLIDIRDVEESSITNENLNKILDFYGKLKDLEYNDIIFIATKSQVKTTLKNHSLTKYFTIVDSKPDGMDKLKTGT